MKLLIEEYKDLTRVADNLGIDTNGMTNWKKKGWVHFKIDSREDHFKFYRRKTVNLTNGVFKNSLTYQAQCGTATLDTENWNDVVVLFGKWLQQLD